MAEACVYCGKGNGWHLVGCPKLDLWQVLSGGGWIDDKEEFFPLTGEILEIAKMPEVE